MSAKKINEVEVRFPADRQKMVSAAIEADDVCVSAGTVGIVADLGGARIATPQRRTSAAGSEALARLIEFYRRQQRWSVADLAGRAGLEQADVLDAEDEGTAPEPRVLYALSGVLGVDYDKLMELAGHMNHRNKPLSEAAVRFAASSKPMNSLSDDEAAALQEFIQALAVR